MWIISLIVAIFLLVIMISLYRVKKTGYNKIITNSRAHDNEKEIINL